MIYFIWVQSISSWSNPAREIYVKAVPVGAGAVFLFLEVNYRVLQYP